MVNNFVFIEEGSVDKENLRKILDNSGMTNANIIRYKQGTTKPELITIENDDSQINLVEHNKNITEMNTAKILTCLVKFLHECGDTRVDRDIASNMDHVYTVYRNTPESLVENFKQFLAEEDNSWF